MCMMFVEISLIVSIAILTAGCIASAALCRLPYRRGRSLSATNCMTVTVFISAFVLLCPLFAQDFEPGIDGVFKTLMIALHTTIRLFVMDGDFVIVLDYLPLLEAGTAQVYSCLAAVLYIMAPMMTFGVILSFFRNVTAYRALYTHFRRELYVFSQLDEKAVCLARSIKDHDRRSTVVFTGVDLDGDTQGELLEDARELGAICFGKSITEINWNYSKVSRKVFLFALGEDEGANLDLSVSLAERYGDLENFTLFVFASGAESEMLFSAGSGEGMRIRRIDPIRTMVEHNLYREGGVFFQNALDIGEPEKLIRVVLLGLGRYGTEMLKALPWLCQMDGYRLEVHAFDRDPDALDRFTALCPELMAPERNGTEVPGEARYRITIHSGVATESMTFQKLYRELGRVSHVFVALGDDSRNIKNAVTMRMLSERMGTHPTIQALVQASGKKEALGKITDYRGHAYDIDFLGDTESCYARDVMVESALYQAALQRHLKWGREREFWAYEFNFRSSVASAIHFEMRRLCGMTGAGKKEEELTPEERDALEVLEHRRWNAYMRSEGYVFSGSTDKASRNDLARAHNDLVPFERLSEEEKRKDSAIGTM